MKRSSTILKEFRKKYKSCENLDYVKGKGKSFYANITGFINDDYFDITIYSKSITLAHTTDKPEKIAAILKEIEPGIRVTYSQVQETYSTVVL